jgi:hypothetical protein
MATDGKGRMLSAVLTAGNINDTTMMAATPEQIRVPRSGRGKTPHPLADHGIKAAIPKKSDSAALPRRTRRRRSLLPR